MKVNGGDVEILWNKLPDNLDELQKKRKIDSLLRPLRKRGKILNKSNGPKSTWKLANDELLLLIIVIYYLLFIGNHDAVILQPSIDSRRALINNIKC